MARARQDHEQEPERGWAFLTNHAHVLACIVEEGGIRLRDVAARVGITERAAQRIVSDLVEAGYLERKRVGRRNVYRAHLDRSLRHPLYSAYTIGDLLHAVPGRRPLRAAR
jgi:DNA-binding MarR family transcriptional regulator